MEFKERLVYIEKFLLQFLKASPSSSTDWPVWITRRWHGTWWWAFHWSGWHTRWDDGMLCVTKCPVDTDIYLCLKNKLKPCGRREKISLLRRLYICIVHCLLLEFCILKSNKFTFYAKKRYFESIYVSKFIS